jgi:hypothetical protein
MSETIFKCSRCGYDSPNLTLFKQHLTKRKTECQPKESNMSIEDVRKQYKDILEKRERREKKDRKERKKKLRNFGNENLDYFTKSGIIQYVQDPLKGIQEIIRDIYFHKDHEENHVVRTIDDNADNIEIFTEDGWLRIKNVKRVFTKMIYKASDIMEYNIPKKNWTDEFHNFIEGMGDLSNDELLDLIIEETTDNVVNACKELHQESDKEDDDVDVE